MIRKSAQAWTVGQTVKVGFVTLVVKAAVATPGDGKPDAYILVNAAGTQLYSFVPHHGLQKVSAIEAQALMAQSEEAAARATYRALAKASADATAARSIAALFA